MNGPKYFTKEEFIEKYGQKAYAELSTPSVVKFGKQIYIKQETKDE